MEYVKIDCPVCGGKKSACLQTESRIFRCHLCGADGELQVRPGSEGMRFKPDGKLESKEEWLKRQPWYKPTVEDLKSENEELKRLLNGANEIAAKSAEENAKLIAERDEYRDLAEKNKKMYMELKEKQYENEREQDQLLNVAANVMHAYIIAKGISAEFKMYGPNGMEDPFPDCCINVAKSIIEKSK